MRVYAHRGRHGVHAENTMQAFEAAERMGIDGIETDLRHTRDGQVVLYHDHAVAGVPIELLSHREIIDLAGHAVPTLGEVTGRAWNCAWNLEIKTTQAWEIARAAITAWSADVIVTSFIHEIPFRAARQTGRPCGLLLASRPMSSSMPQPDHGVDTLVWDWKVIDQTTLRLARQLGWRNASYGMIGVDEHDEAATLDLDFLITDHPERARRGFSPPS